MDIAVTGGDGRVAAGSATVLAVNGLRVERSHHRILDGISFALEAGSLTGLLGPSGCGKTTLMRSIIGVQRITAGAIRVLGLSAGTPELRRRVAYTTQSPAFYADLSVRENLQYFARVLGVGRENVDRALSDVALTALANRVVSTLSGGEQSRTSLAIALLADAEVLILDEPTVGLDPLLRIELWRQFRELAGQGRTLLVSSHVLDEATHCDNLILMRTGLILATGSPVDLCRRTGGQTVEDAFVSIVRGLEKEN